MFRMNVALELHVIHVICIVFFVLTGTCWFDRVWEELARDPHRHCRHCCRLRSDRPRRCSRHSGLVPANERRYRSHVN